MKLKTVNYEKKEGIFIISLNRPEKLNALNRQIWADLLKAMRAAEADKETKVVIIRGEGRAFSAGADLSEELPKEIHWEHWADNDQDVTRVMLRMPKVIIAAVQGYAIGAGMELAECADIRIVAEGTKFGSTETNVGDTVTNAGTKLLTHYIGLGRAREFYFTNEFMDAQQAYEYGLANKVVPVEELDQAAMEMAKKISGNSALALMLTKTAVNRALGMSLEETLVMESRDIQVIVGSAEQKQRSKEAMGRIRAKKKSE